MQQPTVNDVFCEQTRVFFSNLEQATREVILKLNMKRLFEFWNIFLTLQSRQ